MSYQSPFHLIQDLNIEASALSTEEIVRIRKKLLADFNLTGETTIRIKDKEFTKDEVIKQLDVLKNLSDLETHIQIYNNAEVLSFCEQPKKQKNPAALLLNLFNEASTTDKFKGIVIEAEVAALKYSIGNDNFGQLIIITGFFKELSENWRAEAYDIMYQYIENLTVFFETAHRTSYQTTLVKVRSIVQKAAFYRWLNELPSGFEEVRNNLIASIINYTVETQYINKELSIEVTGYLLDINCSPELEKLINKNFNALNEQAETSDTNYGQIARWVFWILFALYKIYSS